MSGINTARDRAEEWIHNLQKRAKDFVEAEEGLSKTIRDLVDDKGLAPAEVRKRLEELVGRIKAARIWERVKDSEAVIFLNDYRDGFERRAEESLQRFFESLQLATRSDVDELGRQVKTLTRKVNSVAKKLKDSAEAE